MILVSAGHHPQSKGAEYEDFNEHDEAVIWASLIKHHLGSKGMLVPADVLKKKINFINAMRPEIAVEVHFNAATIWEDLNKDGIVDEGEVKNVGKGCLTLHYPGSTKGIEIATAIQGAMEQLFDRHWNGVMEGWYRMNKKYGADYFLERTLCPSIIIEPEFIHRRDVIEENRIRACELISETLLALIKR